MIEYSYMGSSDLLATKIIEDRQSGQRRRFYYFYEDAISVREITDNGTGNACEDLTGVTSRFIKQITPNPPGFMYGLPHIVEEKYLDLATSNEVLIQKRALYYDLEDHGNVSHTDHYDANDQYRYTLHYTYDDRGRLIKHTDPLGRVRTIEYDANNNPVRDLDANEAFELSQSPDFMNRPVEISRETLEGEKRTSTIQYNSLGQKIGEIDFRGNKTKYIYDPFGHPTQESLPNMATESGAPQTPITKRTFHPLGQVATERDPEGNITQISYTARGKPYQVKHPDGSVESFTYDPSGHQVKVHLSPEGVRTEYDYDGFDRTLEKRIYCSENNLVERECFIYDAFKLLKKIDRDGISTTYTYDGAGRKIGEETLNRMTTYSYDPLGRMECMTRYQNGHPEQLLFQAHDLLDRVLEERAEDAKGLIYGMTIYSYDDFSNKNSLTKEVQAGKSISRFFYDPFRRLVKSIDPLGHVKVIDYEDNHQNQLGQYVLKKTITDPMGRKTIEIFDVFGNLSTLEKQNASGEILVHEAFFYNLNQKKIKQVSTLYNPHKTITKSWSYDARSRLIELREAVGSPIEKVTTFAYTLDGHLKHIVKPDGTVVAYTYDSLGRQTSILTSDGTCHYQLKHDKMGYLIQSTDVTYQKTTFRKYNHFGDLLEETLANKQSLKNSYDDLGRKTALVFSDGSRVDYHYDPYHLVKVERVSKDGTALYSHHYTEYDRSSNLIGELLPSAKPVAHTVDLLGRRIETETPYSTEQISALDPCSNVLSYKRTLDKESETTEFEYDDLNQLTEERGLFNHCYTYDPHHNRLSKDDSLCTINALHELTATADTSYHHDLNGNRTSALKKDGSIDYIYDGLDRLSQMRHGDRAIYFSYDSWNRCLSARYFQLYEGILLPLFQEDYLYDGRDKLGTYPSQIRILGQGRGAEIGATIAIERAGSIYTPIHDLFGNIIALLDAQTNQPRESYRYTAFGEECIFNQSNRPLKITQIHNPWRYQSKRRVDHLVTFGRRFYDPETGRWLSPDPKGFDEGPNLYQYVRNNPLIYFDLYGLETEKGESYNISRSLKDVAYVYSYTMRSYLEDMAHLRWGFQHSLIAHFAKGVHNVIRGDRRAPEMEHSKVISVGGIPHPEAKFLCTFGMSTSKKEAIAMAEHLSSLVGNHQVDLIHNSSHGLLDLFDVACEKLGIRTNIVKLAEKTVKNATATGKDTYLFNHSEAGLISKNCKFSSEERDKLNIFNFGAPCVHPRNFARDVRNFVSEKDYIALTAGYFDYKIAKSNNASHVHFLTPSSNNILTEHGFRETYVNPARVVCDFIKDKHNIE